MNAFCRVVGEIYSLREALTKNYEVKFLTESNERTYERTNAGVLLLFEEVNRRSHGRKFRSTIMRKRSRKSNLRS